MHGTLGLQEGTLITPVMVSHFLTAGVRFIWQEDYNCYLPDYAQWLVLIYKWAKEWVDKIKAILGGQGVWDRACLQCDAACLLTTQCAGR